MESEIKSARKIVSVARKAMEDALKVSTEAHLKLLMGEDITTEEAASLDRYREAHRVLERAKLGYEIALAKVRLDRKVDKIVARLGVSG